MSIMSAYAESDARGTAWLLADTAKRCLADSALAEKLGYSLNNTYRLLETYRHNQLSGFRKIASRSASGTSELFSTAASSEQHLIEVKEAVEGALVAVFGAERIPQAIDRVEAVLRSTAYPQKSEVDSREKELVVKFFDELVDRLQIR